MPNRCDECLHYRPIPDATVPKGECRAGPPSFRAPAHLDGYLGVWPHVLAWWECGQFSLNPNPPAPPPAAVPEPAPEPAPESVPPSTADAPPAPAEPEPAAPAAAAEPIVAEAAAVDPTPPKPTPAPRVRKKL